LLNIKNTCVADDRGYRPWQIKIFAATWLAYAGYFFCRKAFYVVKVNISGELGLTVVDLAHLGTAYLVFYMVGQFSSAYFGGKLGPKLLLLAGMAISIACNFFFGISNSFWTILLLLSLNGLAQGTGWPCCIGSLAFWFKRDQRGSILGVWSTCYQLGPLLATLFTAYLLGHCGWRFSFFGASLVLMIIWFAVLLLHPNRPEDVNLLPLRDDDEPENTPDESGDALSWGKGVIVTIIMMGMIYFCIKFLRYALWSWLPYFLSKNYNLAADDAGYLSTIFDLCGFAGVLFSGFISDRVFRGKRALPSFIMLSMSALSFVMIYLTGSSLSYFTLFIGLAGFTLYGPDSLISGVGAIDVGSKRGALAAAGIINGMGSIGPIFQEQLIGWMYRFYNQDLLPVLVMLIIVATTGALMIGALWMKSIRGQSNI
jgi:sugar phosphate permease